MGMVAILVMWPGQFKHIFISEGYIRNMVTVGFILAFKEMFEILNGSSWVNGQTMTLTFSPTNLHLLIKTTLITFSMPNSSKLSMKSHVLAFSNICPCHIKRSRSTQGHHLNNLGSTQVPNATYQIPRPSCQLVLEKKIFKDFYHIWAWRQPWSCEPTHLYKFSFPFTHKLS